MGLVRVSDDAENKIKELANSAGRSITAEVDTLLASTDVAARFDKMAGYLKQRLDEMEKKIIASIEDTTIDRLDKGGARKTSPSCFPVYLNWPIVQEMMFEYSEPADWTSPAAKKGMEESNLSDEAKWYIDEGVWGEFYGEKQKYLKLTPHIVSFLKEKGYEF